KINPIRVRTTNSQAKVKLWGGELSTEKSVRIRCETSLRRNVMSEIDSSVNSSVPRNTGEMLERTLRRARWTGFWERLWPPLATLATGIGFSLAVSWPGLWLWLPPIGRAIALGGFALLTAVAMVPLVWVRFPSRHDGLRRLDRNVGLPHRPATAMSDELATPKSDQWSRALWRAHVARALLAARTLRAGRPAPRLDL